MHRDLRDFIRDLEERGWLARVREEVSPLLEVTEVTRRVVEAGGPALLFENVRGSRFPLATNLYGTRERVALALGVERLEEVSEKVGRLLSLKPPSGVMEGLRAFSAVRAMAPKLVRKGPVKEVSMESPDVLKLPVLKCWPGDAGRYITLPLVVTKDPETGERNVGTYRLQVFDGRTLGMHWQVHKGGAEHYRKAVERGERLEVAVVLGGDPITMLMGAAPLPQGVDEFSFAGLLRGAPVELVKADTVDLEVPARAEFVIEGYVEPGDERIEGPFGDHTGYYSPPEPYPVMHVTHITHREDAIYPTTIVGKPLWEDAFMAEAYLRMMIPAMRLVMPEIVDVHMPPEAIIHGMAIVSIRKRYPGQARKVMLGLWGMGLFSLTKIIIVVDHDIDVRDWRQVLWAVATRYDPGRDTVVLRDMPTDTLDHPSPLPNLGGKLGIDATVKTREEGFEREWPEEIRMNDKVVRLVDEKWEKYGISIG